MLKKHKQLFIGVLIGALAMATVSFADEIQTYIAIKADFPALNLIVFRTEVFSCKF